MSNVKNEYVLRIDSWYKKIDIVPTYTQYDASSLVIYVSDAKAPYNLALFDKILIHHRKPGGEIITADAEIVIGASNATSFIRYFYTDDVMDRTGFIGTSLELWFGKKRITIPPFDVKILPETE